MAELKNEPEAINQPSKINDQTSRALDPDLVSWLRANPVLHAALQEARECGRWLITVHRKLKDSPPDDLAGRSVRCDFPTDCILDALQGLCRSILIDEQQARQVDGHRCADKNQWK